MPKKKGFTSEKYKEEILKLIIQHKFMSTNEICEKMNMGFETTIKYLEELSKEKKVGVRNIGNRKFWYKD
jgi:Mn-dependent DtxR family transcriptional regulator